VFFITTLIIPNFTFNSNPFFSAARLSAKDNHGERAKNEVVFLYTKKPPLGSSLEILFVARSDFYF
jgi:hypothetical protein